jgi:hypothetical protein
MVSEGCVGAVAAVVDYFSSLAKSSHTNAEQNDPSEHEEHTVSEDEVMFLR